MKRWLGLLGIGLVTAPLAAQAPDTAVVLAPIHRLFDGMRATDSAMVRSAFHPDARFVRVDTRDGAVRVVIEGIEGFVTAVGGATERWDERLFNTEVRVDGPIASVWTEYTFHVGERLSHCGVDAFELVRGASGWLVTYISDTRRREGCPGG